MDFDTDIQYIKGVGPSRRQKFEKLGVQTVGDLLLLYPRNYIDYTSPVDIAAAPFDIACAVRGEVLDKTGPIRISGGRKMFKVHCADETASLSLTFFNNQYAVDKLIVGREYLFYGRVSGNYSGREMFAPSFIAVGEKAPLTPIYPLTAGLSNYNVQNCVRYALEEVEDIEDFLPKAILAKYLLCTKKEAVFFIHAPKSLQEIEVARRRLIFEELFILQLGLLLMRGRETKKTGTRMKSRVDIEVFVRSLPFALTSAQKRSINEICSDLGGVSPMNRLLQGDVGSGKTLVAAAAMYFAAQNGYQSVLMAPTEILAVQHAETLQKTLSPFGINVALLTAGVKGNARKNVLEAIVSGSANLIVGTHAVLSDPVVFHNLGLAVTDEQHRFGVRQRSQLANKAKRPHLLVMSATPIPRTLALLMFGDLDISVLDELPPGRTPVKTFVITGRKRKDMFGFLQKQIDKGHQAYIVCPLIDDGETDLQAASAYANDIARPLLPTAKVGLMHGKLKAAEKQAVMDLFSKNEINVLVSTTVIEVGVDVPNATVMVIEDAERYGLSALHQLRGRVGRGTAESLCILVSEHGGATAQERLQFLCSTNDGFKVARYDLEHRGPGDFFGNRQHGLPALQIADLATDTRALEAAQKEALAALKSDPALDSRDNAGLVKAVSAMFEKNYTLN